MAAMTFSQISGLVKLIAIAVPDQLDCDGCFELSAEFADAELSGRDLPNALQAVQNHLNQCPCCAYEYQALLEAIRAADSSATANSRSAPDADSTTDSATGSITDSAIGAKTEPQ